jgi:valyl-tRNA synthetase
MALGKCYRCKTVVEPYLSPQWFVDIQPLAEPAIRAVEDGRIRIIPEGWVNNYLGWMREIKDWCISRQIWWGHQIPAWYCERCNAPFIHRQTSTNASGETITRVTLLQGAQPVVARSAPTVCPQCSGQQWLRDPDVLDTWFSSGLWPFSTLGWPDRTPELQTYYPTSTLVTGLDILFFWVARMIMLGLKFMSDVPFREVYIHALVRDAEGQKMSKSKGNVIDPLHVMDQFGTDALRFTLASMASPGRDLKLAEERIEGYRNFANKIWNAARFSLMYLEGPRASTPTSQRPFADRWIRSRLNSVIENVTSELEGYRFDRAANALYQFIWHEYCDWYLELIKPTLQNPTHRDGQATRETLIETLEITMRLLHPFMPFITEEIWQTIPHAGESIVIQRYPAPDRAWEAPDAEQRFVLLEQAVTLVRMGRVLLNYPPGQRIEFGITHDDADTQRQLKDLEPHLAHLCRGVALLDAQTAWPPAKRLRLVVQGLTVGLIVSGDVDLKKALEDQDKELARLTGKLDNQEFVAKAPAEVLTEHRNRLRRLQHDQAMLASSEQQLRALLET